MTARGAAIAAILLWVLTIAGISWVFVKGWTTTGADGRTEIVLAPSERDHVLAEMRQLLKAVHAVVAAAGDPAQGWQEAEQAARAAGMKMAADTDPAIMMKLPVAFKQMGLSIHQDMDALAEAIVQKESPERMLQRLSSMTARCTACHDLFRLSAGR